MIPRFRKQLIQPLIRQLQASISGNFSNEYDVNGICDPFLQVRVLRLMRVLGTGDQMASEAMTDILTQLATSTDPGKNVGHSILYETAMTIMNIESDQSLRTMAINILGRLLSSNSSDNNLRYVALTLLNKIISAGQEGLSAVQRHRGTILECLHDPDISIRKRAVDLALALTFRDTIRNIAGELLQVLDDLKGTDDLEFKQSIITKLSIVSAQFAPSGKWYVDTMITILYNIDDVNSLGIGQSALPLEAVAGRKEEIVSTFVRIINNTAELHRYSSEQLFRATILREMNDLDSQRSPTEALIQATVWTMGEFADILISARLSTESQLVTLLSDWAAPSNGFSAALVGYIISALGKLANRFPSNMVPIISGVLDSISLDYVNDHDLHYRSLEMKAIVNDTALRSVLLARIPPDITGDQLGKVTSASKLFSSRPGSAIRTDGGEGGESSITSPMGTPRLNPVIDVFAELATLSLDGAISQEMSPKAREASPAFTKDGIFVHFHVSGQDTLETFVEAVISNHGIEPISDVALQAAVPKSMKLQMDVADSAVADMGKRITQVLRISIPEPNVGLVSAPKDRIKLRCKLSYRWESRPEAETHIFDVTKFN